MLEDVLEEAIGSVLIGRAVQGPWRGQTPRYRRDASVCRFAAAMGPHGATDVRLGEARPRSHIG